MPKQVKDTRRPWIILIAVLVVLTVFSFGVVGCVSLLAVDDTTLGTGNVAVIPVDGPIVVDGTSGMFSASTFAESEDIVELIEKAEEDEMIEALVFDINSPGGSPVASAEIARAIEEAEKPTVAVIREVGASGAYWVAASTDYIIAHEVSVTGSIGVFASYLQYSELLNRFNVSYERFVSGDHKDMGSPYREMTAEEKARYQEILDAMHDIFIREVAEGRSLDEAYVRTLATGEIYLGIEALDNGLVDALGGKQDAYDYIEETYGIEEAEPVDFETEKGFFELLASALDNTAFNVGTGIGAVLVQEEDSGILV